MFRLFGNTHLRIVYHLVKSQGIIVVKKFDPNNLINMYFVYTEHL